MKRDPIERAPDHDPHELVSAGRHRSWRSRYRPARSRRHRSPVRVSRPLALFLCRGRDGEYAHHLPLRCLRCVDVGHSHAGSTLSTGQHRSDRGRGAWWPELPTSICPQGNSHRFLKVLTVAAHKPIPRILVRVRRFAGGRRACEYLWSCQWCSGVLEGSAWRYVEGSVSRPSRICQHPRLRELCD